MNVVIREDCSIDFELEFAGIDYGDYTVNFDSDFASGGVFYTDSNTIYYTKRIVKQKDTLDKEESYAPANYYPVTSAIFLEDVPSGRHMILTTDRTYGGSSLQSGQLELMFNRRSETNDGMGLSEILDER